MNFRPKSRQRHLWDTWFYNNEGEYYLYYLSNPVGEDGTWQPWDAFSLATSHDLLNWEERGEVFRKSDNPGDWDSEIITTGDIIKFNKQFFMSYRATSDRVEMNNIIVSDDLLNWSRISPTPVLTTADPYESDPSQTVNNYVEMRDVTMTELDNGSVEGIFTARIDTGPHTGRGVLGRAYTNDMVHWELGAPIFAPGKFNVIEVPSRFYRNGRYYLLYCVNSHLESDIGNAAYPLMTFCTGYAFSSQFDGRFEYAADQVLGIGDAYVGRIVTVGDETLFLHHLVSKRPAFCLPKTVIFEDDGTIHLGFWKTIENLALGTHATGFHGTASGEGNGFATCTLEVSGDTCTLRNAGGFGEAFLEGEYADFILDISIDYSKCRSAGFLLNASADEKQGVMLSLDSAKSSAQIGQSKKTYGHLAPDNIKHEHHGSEWNEGRVDVKVVSRSEGFDWYVNGKHFLTTVDEDHLSGRIGLFVREGVAQFSKLSIQPLRAEAQE